MAILSGVSDVKEQQCNLKVAMIAKTAIQVGEGLGTRPAIITAGECGVFFAYADNLKRGLRFTVEEWHEIVDFIDGQLTEQDPESWEPDWAAIPKKYKYVAADKDGKVFAYKYEPERWLSLHCWTVGEMGGSYSELDDETAPAGINWTETLRTRPGVSL